MDRIVAIGEGFAARLLGFSGMVVQLSGAAGPVGPKCISA